MPDIDTLIERLREPREGIHEDGTEELKSWDVLASQCMEAADALVVLRAERDGLRKYAEHLVICPAHYQYNNPSADCTCGLAQLSTNGGK